MRTRGKSPIRAPREVVMQDSASTSFSHVKPGDTAWRSDGLRDFFLYRDLGIAEATGGQVITVELDPSRTALAREHLARARLEDRVELRTEDAAETLRALPDHAFELTFLDAERRHYAGYWPDLVRTLAPGGLLAVDNAISHANELVEFRAVVDDDAGVTQALVPVGAGLLLVVTPG
jgi:predicted O-methyltransferase YrrM